MTAVVHHLPGMAARGTSLNLDHDEVVEASGGYKRPSDQLRSLHARGFVRAHCDGPSGKVVLERSHYEAVTRGQFGQAAANEASPSKTVRPNRAAFLAQFGPKAKA